MHNKRHGYDRDPRRLSNQRNYAMEDNKRRFQDQDYDRYFPEQNAYHPRHDYRTTDYGSEFGYGYGSNQDYANQNINSTFGSDNQSQHRFNEYPNQRNSNRSDYGPQSYGLGYPTYGESSYSQSSQSWSQPVRNDEVSPSSRSFYGKGPKGFKRSDERILEEVSEALFHDHSVDASEIEVSVNDGEVTLTGTVTERRMKRLAEDCVERVAGVTDVKNEIRVQPASFADRSEKTGSLPNTEDSMSSDRLSTSPSSSDKSKSKAPNKLM